VLTLTILAPAKINLALRVLGKRVDGFHQIFTLFQSICLHDRLTFCQTEQEMKVFSSSKEVPAGRSNIVWTAAERLWSASGRRGVPVGVTIIINKQIPTSAGLGGGSSDAVAALRGLCRIWNLSMKSEELLEVASSIGSDVPYFMNGGLAVAGGRGEQLRQLNDLESFWVLLASPEYGVSAKEAYEWFDADCGLQANNYDSKPLLPNGWRSRLGTLNNDLEQSVSRRHPDIGEMRRALSIKGAHLTAMTGSGSTVFGLFKDKNKALSARFGTKLPGWRSLVTQTASFSLYKNMCQVNETSH
tara:strand:- start:247 stop:1149 length:903 start_codon:yes stop_codon:yes gene_type:complete